MTVKTLDSEINDLATNIKAVDGEASAQLYHLAIALGPTGDPAGWAGIDVFRAIDPTRTAQRVRDKLLVDRGLARMEFWRNVLILLPIALTWSGLMYAARGYQEAVAADNTLVGQPFLLLWEERFKGKLTSPLSHFSWLTFSHLALLDVVILTIIVLLTWQIHRRRNISQVQREIDANDLEAKLHSVTWRAALALSQRVSPAAIADQFRHASEELLDALRAHQEELAKLATWREREIADLEQYLLTLRQSTAQLEPFSQQVNASLGLLTQVSEKLEGQLRSVQQAESELVTALGTTSQDIHFLLTTTEQGAAATAGVSQSVTLLQATLGELRDQLSNERQAYADAADKAKGAADALQRSVQDTLRTVPTVGQLITDLGAVAPKLQSAAELQQQTTAAMNQAAALLNARFAGEMPFVTTQQAGAATSPTNGSDHNRSSRWRRWIG